MKKIIKYLFILGTLIIFIVTALYLTNKFTSTVSYEEVGIVRKTEKSIVIINNIGRETEIFAEMPTIQLIDESKRYMVRYHSTLFSKPRLKSIESVR
ncbi:hypothetical protein QJQ58_17155 [Paenibacillus dendritiformis]|uniref:hypothetical protein n=1 Tax=Paenibacillus dendritiformis TaxID=130049 RepID=UPI00248B9B9B|nr:hypothetical protein [Paenibacillus dendritiformis]WGU92309.1 hypothetical protein QJQ58_17155 [Paenibacillus dendritiformis]